MISQLQSSWSVRRNMIDSDGESAINQQGQQKPARLPQNVECPFARISKDTCPWKGLVTGIKDHVKAFHKNLNDTLEANGVFNVVLTGLSPTQHYRKAVFTADELFYIYWRIKDGSFYCAVFYVGEQEKSSNYKYRFVLTTESDNRKISMSFPTRSTLENLEELLQSGDCVILNYNTLLKFLDPNMNLECEFQINASEQAVDIPAGVNQPNLYAESDCHSSLLGRSRRHRRRHENERSFGSSDKRASVFKPGRCVHGRRFGHCRICKYSAVLTNVLGSNDASGAVPLQNNQPQTVFYCAPSGNFAEAASAAYKVWPSAPAEKDLYCDPVGNISPSVSSSVKSFDEKCANSDRSLLAEQVACSLPPGHVPSSPSSHSAWKCPICGQTAPSVPVSLPDPGWHVSSSLPDSKQKCKMCGQIQQ
ncbi:hypothetical protein Cfor_11123 [Coptotermes formosanus]|uniref:E3 ubiquitin-protein ligase n=1 Tax=Coptotermes formosanus TaxID=36987 RepID=A0A6L2Q9V8_COPFO|nr:hypothetical protein Cfor_11123 [Coptotermes formosanus]